MMTASIVAIFGAIMAAPLATPLTVIFAPAISRARVAVLGKVSVVIMAVAASRNASDELASRVIATGIPSARFSRGKKRPITPVEQTKTSSSAHPRSRATCEVIQRASSSPRVPVQALALPELMITARAVPRGSRVREILTGAPHTRFVVKTPTAVAGPSATKTARSSFEGSLLMPQCTPAARNPAGRTQEAASSIFLLIVASRSFQEIRSSN